MSPYDPLKHHRRSIRLQGYDYSRAGAYFVTAVTGGRLCLYGEVADGAMVLNAAGQMIETWWLELNHKFPSIETDAYVVMPNHFHGIIVIADDAAVATRADTQPGPDPTDPHLAAPAGVLRHRAPLSEVMQWFKTMTTNGYIRGVATWTWPRFDRKLWQRDYFERIIRDEAELDRTRQYLDDNPLHWDQDDENPAVAATGWPRA